jgi:hypothetical protein
MNHWYHHIIPVSARRVVIENPTRYQPKERFVVDRCQTSFSEDMPSGEIFRLAEICYPRAGASVSVTLPVGIALKAIQAGRKSPQWQALHNYVDTAVSSCRFEIRHWFRESELMYGYAIVAHSFYGTRKGI